MTRILEMAPSLADHLYQKGVDYEELGELDEAMRAFRRAVQAHGTHLPSRLALAYHYRRLDRYDEALAECEAALAEEPSATAYFLLGHVLVAKQVYQAARFAFQRCLALDPTFERARYQLALIYYLQGEYEVAITEFHRAAQHGADWETYFFLGESYRMTRRPLEALHILRRAMPLATGWEQIALTQSQSRACERLAEFPQSQALGSKEQAYCDHGIIHLGSGKDDGVQIPSYLSYRFDYPHLAVTLCRFIAVARAQAWQWEAVLPVDIVSLPLAQALARHFGVGTEPRRGGRTLVVQALGETVEGLQDAASLGATQTFCLLSCWREPWQPDVVGLATPLLGSLPWFRPPASSREPGWMDPRPPEAIATDILSALAATPEESTLPAQLAYYEQHPRLRWR